MALLFLARYLIFSSSSSSSSSSLSLSPDLATENRKQEEQLKNMNMEPNFVVVMAGHEIPTCLAKPIASANYEV